MAPLGPVYLSYSHTIEDINSVLEKLNEVCVFIQNKVKDNNYEKHLEGKLPKKIWDLKIPPTVKR
jgi:hypothetical protein